MRSIRIVGLCLVAAFALSALVASAAQASEPEWGRCIATKKGEYASNSCTTKSSKPHKGSFEWYGGGEAVCYPKKGGEYSNSSCSSKSKKPHKGKYEKSAGNKFTSAGGAGVLHMDFATCELENGEDDESGRYPKADCKGGPETPYPGEGWGTNGGQSVECESEHASGEAVGSDEVANVSVRFVGCTALGLPATSAGLPAGEIQVNPLKGRLGYISKAAHEVGVLLEPASAGGKFAEFEIVEGRASIAVGEGNAVEGSFYETDGNAGDPTGNDGIISPITPVNRMTHTFEQDYRADQIESECPYPKVENCRNINTKGYGQETGPPYYPVRSYANIPTNFEGGQRESLEGYLESQTYSRYTGWSSAGQEIENTNTVEGESEIKA